MRRRSVVNLLIQTLGLIGIPCLISHAEPVVITVDTPKPLHRVSRFLTGACIEDVNHEIYGGLYSQMIFGESFQEPPAACGPKDFTAVEGAWSTDAGILTAPEGAGPKLLAGIAPFADGEFGVDVFFPDQASGNAGIIARVSDAGRGADSFAGYEISLYSDPQMLRLGRHQHNWELLSDTPCNVPVGQWISLRVTLKGDTIEVSVDGRHIASYKDAGHALGAGVIGLRQWQRPARYRNLWYSAGDKTAQLPFQDTCAGVDDVSGMWRPVQRATATGSFSLDRQHAFLGVQSQHIAFTEGAGEWGIENQGLNRWGLCFQAQASYTGLIWARAKDEARLRVAIENRDGAACAETVLTVVPGDWQQLPFELVPSQTFERGRFAITLTEPGSVDLGYVFLEPGDWGRFKGLPVRRDVAEALIDQGITFLRYGGSMVNDPDYRWKNMIGPRDRRPPYHGTWYPYSTNGWGILDFMNFCEAAGFEYAPAFNASESPQDMADFVEYAKGAPDSPWGAKRVADGHPEPYKLKYIQIGNEERVDEEYAARFAAIAEKVWPVDPELTLVVGDFVYSDKITDPFHVTGSMAKLDSLRGQQQILELARAHDREVWFDLHVGTDGPRPDNTFDAMFTFIDALEKIANGARFRVVVFEFNSGNHTQRRALANALAINAIQRDGRIPVALSANCLQPDGQNDNAWDQGLLFLNPSQVWLQPPGWVTHMVSRHYQPVALPATVSGTDALDVSAKRSEDGSILVLQVVNSGDTVTSARIATPGFSAQVASISFETLAAPLDTANTDLKPDFVTPQPLGHTTETVDGTTSVAFPAHSITVAEYRIHR